MVPDEHVPRNIGLRKDDGLCITDTESGDCNLLISIRDIVKRTVTEKALYRYEDLEVYGFHCKWNPQGDRFFSRYVASRKTIPPFRSDIRRCGEIRRFHDAGRWQ